MHGTSAHSRISELDYHARAVRHKKGPRATQPPLHPTTSPPHGAHSNAPHHGSLVAGQRPSHEHAQGPRSSWARSWARGTTQKRHPIRPCMLDVRLSNGRKRRAGWRGAPVHGRAATAGTTRQRGADEGARRVPERPGLCAPMGPLWVHGAVARV